MGSKSTNIQIANWIAVGILFASTSQAIAVPMYQALGLGSLTPGGQNYGYAINSSGQIVGVAETSTGGSEAFLYSNGSMVGLGTLPGYTSSYAYDINDSGQIVGASSADGNSITMGQAFIYNNGAMSGLGTLPGGLYSTAHSINNVGVVVGQSLGYSAGTSFLSGQPFVANSGVMTSIPDWSGGGFATKISNDGQVLIYNWGGAIYANGLINPAPCVNSLCYMADINTRGEIVGFFQSENGGPIAAFIYKDHEMVPLGLSGHGNSINDNGEVVGFNWNSEGLTNAFLYTGDHLYDLNSLVDSSLGWIIWDAKDINNSALIVAYGQNTLTGYIGGILLTPISVVPEPGTSLLLLIGLILMVVSVRTNTLPHSRHANY